MTSLASRISIQQGDITDMQVDAIVNAANNDLMLGAGVAGAILRKGGEEIQRECDAIGSIPVGYAAITGAGNLPARFVIHAASMGLGGVPTTAKSLRTSVAHAFRLAADRELKSIAFPAIGTGVSGFPLAECAQIMLAEAVRHLQNGSPLLHVYFVLFDSSALRAFESEWARVQADPAFGAASA